MSAPDSSRPRWVTYVQHPDDEWFDRVTIETVERWKESGLSGDEWRFSHVVKLWRKDQVVRTLSRSRLQWALAWLPALAVGGLTAEGDEEPIPAVIAFRDEFCFQPGCPEYAAREFRLLRLYDKSGAEFAESENGDSRMRFCYRHAGQRGDCGLLDADRNMVEVPYGAPVDAPPVEFPQGPVSQYPGAACPLPGCDETFAAALALDPEDRWPVYGRMWRAHMEFAHGVVVRTGEEVVGETNGGEG